MATEFSLESVRQYMLAHEGKVTNHDLVKHYKAWLTHPIEKESARQKFKEYVNTLSTIKVEDGIKFLVLKKKFFPTFADPSPQNVSNDLGPSLLDEVMSTYQQKYQPPPPQPRRQLPPTPNVGPGEPLVPPPYYKAPPPPNYRQPPPPPPQHSQNLYQAPHDFGLPLPSDYGLPTPRQGVFHPPGPSSITDHHNPPPPQQQQYYPPPPLPRRNDPQHMSRSSSMMSMTSQLSAMTSIGGSHYPYNDLGLPSRSNSVQMRLNEDLPPSVDPSIVPQAHPPPLPTRNNSMMKEPSPSVSSTTSMTSNNSSRKASISEDKENNGDLETASSTSSLLAEKAKQEKISVKERTKTFNRMASEVSIGNMLKQSKSRLVLIIFKM